MISYYEVSTGNDADKSDKAELETALHPRGVLELTSGTVVAETDIDGKPFGFQIIPLPAMRDDAPVCLKEF